MNNTIPELVWPVDREVDEEELDHHEGPMRLDYDAMVMLANLPPLAEEILSRNAALPIKTRSSGEYTLVLDLDETLVHCSLNYLDNSNMVFPVDFQGMTYQVYVRIRPFLRTFLTRMSKVFEIIVFTASKKCYANKLCDILDPQKTIIKHRLFREHCVCVYGNYVKDLSILGRDMTKTIILDNAIQSFAYQLNNGVPIESWFHDRNDTELLKLCSFFETIPAEGRDVREILHHRYRLRDHIPFYSIIHQQEGPGQLPLFLPIPRMDAPPVQEDVNQTNEQLITQVAQKPAQVAQG
ncbi:Protein CBR-SCPL-3 [Caenorhabditis briggsae]|nr:Protein CBR-SCPL-3 [Caenorhabditis briggsae]PIC51503.1 hypothetical protein B9Z55_001994 [Caenorhabditis nigoni]ULU11944.1 hypothetical protein L3Y34_015361 [Caenorhabditis briggsae]UMM12892.1 hypothetical protein L5515_001441 [Caenorhabditis briggsae]CAP31238.1 Protein CBR-SCPL-3 [Caenorhabditis briggsae]